MDFYAAINDHLELRRRNARLESRLPLDRYRGVASIETLAPKASRAHEETHQNSPSWLAGSEADANSGWAWQDE